MDSSLEEFDSTNTADKRGIPKIQFARSILVVLVLCFGCLFAASNYLGMNMSTISRANVLTDSAKDGVPKGGNTSPRNDNLFGITSLAQTPSACEETWKNHFLVAIEESMEFFLCKILDQNGGPCLLDQLVQKAMEEKESEVCEDTEKQCSVTVSSNAEGEHTHKLCTPIACQEKMPKKAKEMETVLRKKMDSAEPEIPNDEKPNIRVTC